MVPLAFRDKPMCTLPIPKQGSRTKLPDIATADIALPCIRWRAQVRLWRPDNGAQRRPRAAGAAAAQGGAAGGLPRRRQDLAGRRAGSRLRRASCTCFCCPIGRPCCVSGVAAACMTPCCMQLMYTWCVQMHCAYCALKHAAKRSLVLRRVHGGSRRSTLAACLHQPSASCRARQGAPLFCRPQAVPHQPERADRYHGPAGRRPASAGRCARRLCLVGLAGRSVARRISMK